MNGLVPALIAVLLCECGARAAGWRSTSNRVRLAIVIVALIVAAGVSGALVARYLTTSAATLLAGLALLFGAYAQLRAPTGNAELAFWRGATPFLVFAFAARFGPVPVVIGAIGGCTAAYLIALPAPHAQRIAGGLLATAGLFAALAGLRLI